MLDIVVNMLQQIIVMMECMLQPKKRVMQYAQMVNALKIYMQKRMESLSKSPFATKYNDSYSSANEYAKQYMKDLRDATAKMDMRGTSVSLKQEKVSSKRKRKTHQVVTLQ